MAAVAGGRHSSPLRASIEGICAGVVCALASIGVQLLIIMIKLQSIKSTSFNISGHRAHIVEVTGSIAKDSHPVVPVIIGPLLETLLFALIFMGFKLDGFSKRTAVKYVMFMSFLGWLLHGASMMSINRCIPFAILAGLFVRWFKAGGMLPAVAVTTLAHVVWNASLWSVSVLRTA